MLVGAAAAEAAPEAAEATVCARMGPFTDKVTPGPCYLQVMDPCHANFTHHKVQGARQNEKGTDIKPLTPPTPAGEKLGWCAASYVVSGSLKGGVA